MGSDPGGAPAKPFADRLEGAIDAKRSCLIVGLDPVLDRLPAEVHAAVGGYTAMDGAPGEIHTARAAAALSLFCLEVTRAVAPCAVAVKPNAAFFERYGSSGWDGLREVCREARKLGLLVILDAKRGDLSSTATAYAEALLGDQTDTVGPWVDALTVNPYFGEDGVEPFLEAAHSRNKGLFVLVRTSNPSASEFQELESDGKPLYLHVAGAVARWGATTVSPSGWSTIGAVVGATAPEQAARVRAALPRSFFLVPGFGAQGAGAESVRPHFLPAGRGVVVNASRSIIYAFEKEGERPWTESVARAAETARDQLEAVRSTVGGRG